METERKPSIKSELLETYTAVQGLLGLFISF